MSNKNTSGMEIDDAGNVTIYESERDKERRVTRRRIEEIKERISNPSYDPAEISRMIAVEIAVVAGKLTDIDVEMGALGTTKLKAYTEQIKALRELGKQLTDADVLSKKDILNFDGPKFIFVLGIIVDSFVKAMKEAGISEDLRTSVMKHYRDEMQINEEKIRKETAKVGEK